AGGDGSLAKEGDRRPTKIKILRFIPQLDGTIRSVKGMPNSPVAEPPGMLLDNSFLQTIFAHLEDDGPRLVYADWLEERGNCERAELIRLQCLNGPEERAQELLTRH